MEEKLVLLVDSDVSSLERLQEILEKNKYQVRAVQSGDQAISFMNSTKPDCVVFEVDLPGMSGTIMYSKIRRSPELKDIPCVVCSSVGPRPVDLGTGIPVLRKDCSEAEFLETVNTAVGIAV